MLLVIVDDNSAGPMSQWLSEIIRWSTVDECFSTGVCQWYPRLLRDRRCSVKKLLNCVWHLRSLEAFSRLLVGPKCICGQGSTPNPTGEAYNTPPEPVAGGEGLAVPSPWISPPLSALGLEFLPFGPQESLQATKIAAKGSASLKRLKNTDVVSETWTELSWDNVLYCWFRAATSTHQNNKTCCLMSVCLSMCSKSVAMSSTSGQSISRWHCGWSEWDVASVVSG